MLRATTAEDPFPKPNVYTYLHQYWRKPKQKSPTKPSALSQGSPSPVPVGRLQKHYLCIPLWAVVSSTSGLAFNKYSLKAIIMVQTPTVTTMRNFEQTVRLLSQRGNCPDATMTGDLHPKEDKQRSYNLSYFFEIARLRGKQVWHAPPLFIRLYN